jgi:hypothetical protein
MVWYADTVGKFYEIQSKNGDKDLKTLSAMPNLAFTTHHGR